jgi:hypothetical protein
MTTTKTETADIVERLRKSANTIYSQDGYTFRLGLHNEAADEIERLRKVNVMQARWLHEAQQEHEQYMNYVRKLFSEDVGNAALKEKK